MRISVPQGTHVGAVHAQQDPPGPPPVPADEPPLASDEEWETETDTDEETPPPPTQPTVERNGMGGMARIQNTGIHADFY